MSIDGEIIPKPMRQGKHSKIQGKLLTAINAVVAPRRIAYAFPELRYTFGGRSIVPDVSVFVENRIPSDQNGEIANVFQAAPDWAIEILSPEQRHAKVTKKILHCLEHNTQMGWIIYLDERTVFIYAPLQQTQVFDEPEQQLPVPDFASEARLTIGQLFGWLLV